MQSSLSISSWKVPSNLGMDCFWAYHATNWTFLGLYRCTHIQFCFDEWWKDAFSHVETEQICEKMTLRPKCIFYKLNSCQLCAILQQRKFRLWLVRTLYYPCILGHECEQDEKWSIQEVVVRAVLLSSRAESRRNFTKNVYTVLRFLPF